MTALQIGVGCVLSVAIVVSVVQLGRRAMIVAFLALLVPFGGVPLVHAEDPEECRRQCSLDLEACRDGCLNSHFFDGCLDDCHSVEEDCLSACR